jgi:hypothetical protein
VKYPNILESFDPRERFLCANEDKVFQKNTDKPACAGEYKVQVNANNPKRSDRREQPWGQQSECQIEPLALWQKAKSLESVEYVKISLALALLTFCV